MWIIGEYALSTDDIDVSFSTIQEELGPLPFIDEEKKKGEDDEDDEKHSDKRESPRSYRSSNTAVLSDGTYATQSALTATVPEAKQIGGSLRTLLEGGDFFLGSSLAVTLTKFVSVTPSLSLSPTMFFNRCCARCKMIPWMHNRRTPLRWRCC